MADTFKDSLRYAPMGEGRFLLCRDCSTRTTGVMIPANERKAHNAWHNERTAA